jgi:hypothetical protein
MPPAITLPNFALSADAHLVAEPAHDGEVADGDGGT